MIYEPKNSLRARTQEWKPLIGLALETWLGVESSLQGISLPQEGEFVSPPASVTHSWLCDVPISMQGHTGSAAVMCSS